MADCIEEKDITNTEVKSRLDFDTMLIHKNHVVIRTIKQFLNANGEVVRTKQGKEFLYQNIVDNPETPEDETNNRFNRFMIKLGLNLSKLRIAIREMEQEG